MKPIQRSKLRLWAGKQYFTCKRYLNWITGKGGTLARVRSLEPLEYRIFAHQTPLMRQLRDVDMWYQHHKVINLRIAVGELNGLLLLPGETLLQDEWITENHALMMYAPLLPEPGKA
ncbi:hypothetical protein JCM10914A_25340 [Paenibacillus sp. JCM 10914]